MKLSFLERYGLQITCGLITLFAWRLISLDLHESAELRLLFPLSWLTFTPLSSLLSTLHTSFGTTFWWMWVEVACTVLGWMFVYCVVRGMFNALRSMEGPSMWVAFVFCLLLAVILFAFLVRPAFDQMTVWWKAWPEAKVPQLP